MVPKYMRNPMNQPKWSLKDIERAKERANKPPTSWMGAIARGVAIKQLEKAGIEWKN